MCELRRPIPIFEDASRRKTLRQLQQDLSFGRVKRREIRRIFQDGCPTTWKGRTCTILRSRPLMGHWHVVKEGQERLPLVQGSGSSWGSSTPIRRVSATRTRNWARAASPSSGRCPSFSSRDRSSWLSFTRLIIGSDSFKPTSFAASVTSSIG